MNITIVYFLFVSQLQVSLTYGDDYASDMFRGVSWMYFQHVHAGILHHYGTLKNLKR